MQSELNDIDDLIGKFLAGEASENEQLELAAWLDAAEENRAYFRQIKMIFEKAATASVAMNFDADMAWQKVKSQLGAPKEIIVHPSSGWTVWKLAAAVTLLAGVGYAAWVYTASAPEIRQFAASSIVRTDTLPDGTVASLNHKSSMTWQYNAREKERKVKLAGEAFFHVKHDTGKPFVIEAEEVLVRDIGTSFNVNAWPESNTVEVTVSEGEVQVYTLNNPGMTLHAGEKGIYDKALKAFSKIETIDTNVLAWKTKVFTFNNTDLRSVVALVNSVYESNITLSNESLNNCRLTVNFNNDKLETIVEVLSETMDLKVTKKDSEIILDGPGCPN